jgi:hypothetical protein
MSQGHPQGKKRLSTAFVLQRCTCPGFSRRSLRCGRRFVGVSGQWIISGGVDETGKRYRSIIEAASRPKCRGPLFRPRTESQVHGRGALARRTRPRFLVETIHATTQRPLDASHELLPRPWPSRIIGSAQSVHDAEEDTGREHPHVQQRSRLVYSPTGGGGILSPGNTRSRFLSEVIRALLAGNAVVLKVASDTMEVGRALKTCVEAAASPGFFPTWKWPAARPVPPSSEAGGQAFFTGSTGGPRVMALARRGSFPSGRSSAGPDVPVIETTPTRTARCRDPLGGLRERGQSCAGVQRILVHRAVHDARRQGCEACVTSGGDGEDSTATGSSSGSGRKRSVRDS